PRECGPHCWSRTPVAFPAHGRWPVPAPRRSPQSDLGRPPRPGRAGQRHSTTPKELVTRAGSAPVPAMFADSLLAGSDVVIPSVHRRLSGRLVTIASHGQRTRGGTDPP